MSIIPATPEQAAVFIREGKHFLECAELEVDRDGSEIREVGLTDNQRSLALQYLASIGLDDTVKTEVYSVMAPPDISIDGSSVFPALTTMALKAIAPFLSTEFTAQQYDGRAARFSKEVQYLDTDGEYSRRRSDGATFEEKASDVFSMHEDERRLGLSIVTYDEAKGIITLMEELYKI